VLRRLDLRGAAGDLAALLPRPDLSVDAPTEAVRELLGQVREGGDAAVRELTKRFDGVDLVDAAVAPDELAAAWPALDDATRAALQTAHDRVLAFHEA